MSGSRELTGVIGRLPGMRCDQSHELLSAELDGELEPDERAGLESHLAGCGACRAHAAELSRLHRALRVTVARPAPDLTAAILAAHDGRTRAPAESGVQRRRGRATLRWREDLRWVLGVLGGLQVAVAAPGVLWPATEHLGHTGSHSAGWDLAFGLGLVVVAMQPWRARGMLPLATAVTVVMVGTVVGDAVSGRAEPMPQLSHVIEVVSLALLWGFSRWYRGEAPLSPGSDAGDGGVVGAAAALRVLGPHGGRGAATASVGASPVRADRAA